VKTIGLLLDNVALPGSLPRTDLLISLLPPAQLYARSSELVDGEQVYALHKLIGQADDLAMEWARAITAAMAADSSWQHLLSHDLMDLRPLLVNRLFLGFFIQHARTYLSTRRILEIESPQQVTLYTAGGIVTEFAAAACRTLGIAPDITRLPRSERNQCRLRISPALNTLVRDIVGPSLRYALPGLPRRSTNLAHIVFLERGLIHIEMIAQALDALRKLRDVKITIVRFDPKQPAGVYPHARYIALDSYQNLSTLVRLLVFQAQVMVVHSLPQDWPESLPRSIALGAKRFAQQVALPSIVYMLEVVRRIIRVERPHLLITVDETGLLGKSVALQGRRRGVPTLNVQHGIRVDSPWLEDQLFDRLAVFGERDRELFIRRGASPMRVVATGMPRYDRLALRQDLKSRAEVAADLELDPERPIVVFASQAPIGRITSYLKAQTHLAVADAALALPEVQFVVKLHHVAQDHVPDEVQSHPGAARMVTVRHYDLYDLLNACDVMITIYSTVGLEAAILDKPILIINLSQLPDFIPYTEEGVAVTASCPEQVSVYIRRLLNDQALRQRLAAARDVFLRRYVYRADGRSADRLAQLMEQMIDGCFGH
jgi:hypothetical protein